MRNISKVIIHCSATSSGWMEGQPAEAKRDEIKRWHVEDRRWSDIGYHVLIDRDGSVVEGRPMARTGAHVRGHNTGSIGVCLIGGRGSSADDAFDDNYTPEQKRALHDLLIYWKHELPPFTIHGHNEFAAKACPGFNVGHWLKVMGLDEPKASAAEAGSLDRFRKKRSRMFAR